MGISTHERGGGGGGGEGGYALRAVGVSKNKGQREYLATKVGISPG